MSHRLKSLTLSLVLTIGALLTALALSFAAPASAFPNGDNSTWQTAKIDAQLKPEFRSLIRDGRYRPRSNPCAPGRRWYGSSRCCADQYGYSVPCQTQQWCDPTYDQNCCPSGSPPDQYGQCPASQCQGPLDQQGQCMCPDGQTYPDQYGQCQPTAPYGQLDHVTVDCRNDPQGANAISYALSMLADGGTLHLKGKGPACTGTMEIHRPVVVLGDRPSMFALEGDAGRATITAPPGAPCAIIDAGARGGVEFRGVIFEASQAGRSACIQIEQTRVGISGGGVHYKGESSAIFAHGGELKMYDTDITSTSLDPAVWTEATALDLRGVGVSTAGTGFDVLPAGGDSVRLDHVHIVGVGSGLGGDPVAGFIGRRTVQGDDRMHIIDSHIEGFRTGALFERGARPEIIHSRIVHSRLGVAIDGANVTVRDSVIEATEFGAYAYSGVLDVDHTTVASVLRCPLAGDPGAILKIGEIQVFSDRCECSRTGTPGAYAGFHFHLRAELKVDLGVGADFNTRRWGWDR